MSNITRLDQYNNKWYSKEIGANALKRMLWYIFNTIFFSSRLFPFNVIKVFLLRNFGAKLGKGVVIKPCVNIKYPWKLEIGNYCWIGEGVWIDSLAKVRLGDHVCISQGAMLLTGNHNYKSPTFDLMVGEINLENGVWVGAKAIICPGVIAHEHAVLTVGSVATTDLEPNGIYKGNPALKRKEREIG
ncbi:MAG: WcaF family extracellular polysaccharide biosynthesis acetyltransferase [Chitinophagaceae bacterium]